MKKQFLSYEKMRVCAYKQGCRMCMCGFGRHYILLLFPHLASFSFTSLTSFWNVLKGRSRNKCGIRKCMVCVELQSRLDSVVLIALDSSLAKCGRFCNFKSKQTPQVENLTFHLILLPPVQIQMKIIIEKHINIFFSVVSSSSSDEKVHIECFCKDGSNQIKYQNLL